MKMMTLTLKHIEESLNRFSRKQKTSIIARYLTLNVILSNSYGLTLTAVFRYPKPKLIYTVNHKNGGRTFVIITLENLDRFS